LYIIIFEQILSSTYAFFEDLALEPFQKPLLDSEELLDSEFIKKVRKYNQGRTWESNILEKPKAS